MQVEEQPRNTPVLSGPQKAIASDALLGWFSARYGTKDLVNLDPMACFGGHVSAPERSRNCVRPVPITFECSAAGFQLAADHGYPARITLAEALGGTDRALKVDPCSFPCALT